MIYVVILCRAQVVGWPPVRSFRKNCLQASKKSESEASSGLYVKVSMDGAPYLRKEGHCCAWQYDSFLGKKDTISMNSSLAPSAKVMWLLIGK